MSILCFGLSHQTIPLHLLEPLTFDPDDLSGFLSQLKQSDVIREAVGLCTCNRTEFYLESEEPANAREILLNALARRAGTDISYHVEHSYTHQDLAAVRHLFRVTSGIDSLVIGERQIIGQVHRADGLATEAAACGKLLHKLFTTAVQAARRVHQETNIGHGNVSVASVAVNITKRVFTDLTRKKVLIVGAGQTGKLAATHFKSSGIGEILVTNRTHKRAEELADTLEGRAVPFADFDKALSEVDIVAVATGSPDYLVTPEIMKKACKRRQSLMVLLDLSIPRNVDPKVAKNNMAFLYTIEDLESVAEVNRAQRHAEISQVEAIIEEEIGRYSDWTARLEADRLVVALRRRVEEIRKHHLDRFANKTSPEVVKAYDKFTDSLLRSVLHDLTRNLRDIDLHTDEGQAEYQRVVQLFNL